MEAGDPGAIMQSGTASYAGNYNTKHTAGHHHHQQQHPQQPRAHPPLHAGQYQHSDLSERSYREHSAMATAAVATPTAHYLSQPRYQPHTAPHHGSSPAMIPSELRKSSDDEPSGRQSLPSISEVISGTKPGHYPGPQPPPPPPPHAVSHGGPGLPSPFPPAPRSYPEAEKLPSPQPMHTASYAPRQEPLPSFASSPRSGPFGVRSVLPPVHDRRPGSSSRSDGAPSHAHDGPAHRETYTSNGTYHAHTQSGTPLPPPMSYQGGQLPPGQMPLPGYPVSPRHQQHQHVAGHYENRVPPLHRHHEESENGSRARHDSSGLFENWSYEEGLGKIAADSRTIFNFAEGWVRAARDTPASARSSDQLPPEDEINAMLANAEHLKRSLEQVREMVQISIQNERAREGARARAFEEEQDAHMYSGGSKPQYAMTAEVKKRRGRAAPPGRCHSCNRIDTPEWRRGPDGARTLCNACGLHYAKLERKRQLEEKTIRPKHDDRN